MFKCCAHTKHIYTQPQITLLAHLKILIAHRPYLYAYWITVTSPVAPVNMKLISGHLELVTLLSANMM